LITFWTFKHVSTFLADRTNGRAYSTMLRPSVSSSVCLFVTYVLSRSGAS